ncbi:hypothetical protein N0V86_004347 [Didymella sp. IMI 355093]|nr:hypothetical protein N0V86_004347 [Didymella sp. IMI 355093]
MKVLEKGNDRTAYVHVYVKGQVNPLNEYGQYIDARDRAVCCYVAVEEGHEIKVDGRFNGVTLTVAYDCIVDGICRKANSYAGKSVQLQKHKKLDIESFLYQTSDGVIDTQMSVAPYTGTTNLSKEVPETVGTIELRVYITRQFDVEHMINKACTYDHVREDSQSSASVATYKDVPPQFQMAFEKNCSILEVPKGKRENKKVHAKRPGTEPWAIFRFHYRTKESIMANKMELSFDAADNAPAKQDAHPLELESLPSLMIGSKPASKNDGDNSPKVDVRKNQIKPDTTTTDSTSDMASITDTKPATDAEAPVKPKDLLGHLQSTPTKTEVNATTIKTTKKKESDDSAPTTKKDHSGDSAASTPKRTTKKASKRNTETIDADLEKSSEEALKKMVKKADDKKDPESTDAVSSNLFVEASNAPTVPHPADMPSVFDAPAATSAMAVQVVVPGTKDFIKSSGKSFTSPLKKAATKPAAIDTTTSTVPQKPANPSTPASPLKRAPEGTLTPPPDMKRIRTDGVLQLTPVLAPRSLTASLSPRPLSIEAQVAEQRKHLEAMRKKRAEMANKKAVMDEKLAPYKQRMAEELGRLRQEAADEEAMMAADEEDYMASETMLAEFERGDSGF